MSNTPEGKVKAKVREIFKRYQIHYNHIAASQFSKAGAPDYVCCVNGFFLAVEVKAGKGVQTEPQKIEQASVEKSMGRYFVINETNLNTLEMYIYALKGKSMAVLST